MTGAIFTHWLSQWNEQLHRQKRKVLLLIDNAPGHVCDEYDNIEIVFLLPNITSILQALDQSIILWVKRQYRKLLAEQYPAWCEKNKDIKTIMKSSDFVVACKIIKQVWGCCTQQTISNCFTKAGFPDIPAPEPTTFQHLKEISGKISRDYWRLACYLKSFLIWTMLLRHLDEWLMKKL